MCEQNEAGRADRQDRIDGQRNARRMVPFLIRNEGIFQHGQWQDGDFSETDWSGENFSQSDLSRANLRGSRFFAVDFTDTKLCDADLSDTDLSNARNLVPAQLAGTDLTRAKLPPDFKFPALDQVKEISQNASKVFLTLLAVLAFTVLTATSARHEHLISNGATADLPVIGVKVPILGFFLAAPVLIGVIYVYLHFYIYRLADTLRTLPSRFPDGRVLDETTYPWLVNDLTRAYLPRLESSLHPIDRFQMLMISFIIWWLPPGILWFIWAKGLPAQHPSMSLYHAFIFTLLLSIGVFFRWLLQARFTKKYHRKTAPDRVTIFNCLSASLSPLRANGTLAAISLGACLVGIFWMMIGWTRGVLTATALPDTPPPDRFWAFLIDSEPNTLNRIRNAYHRLKIRSANGVAGWQCWGPAFLNMLGLDPRTQIWSRDISIKPPGFTGDPSKAEYEIARVQGVNLTGQRLHHAWAWSSFFANAVLENADLERGNFTLCDFRGANFFRGSAFEAQFQDAIFSYALPPANDTVRQRSIEPVRFQEFKFTGATFNRATLLSIYVQECDFKGAQFKDARLQYSSWLDCDLGGANFQNAKLQKTQFGHRNPKEKRDGDFMSVRNCDFRDASFEGATFSKMDFTGAKLNGTNLRWATFDQCTGLDENTLRGALNVTEAYFFPPLAPEVIERLGASRDPRQ